MRVQPRRRIEWFPWIPFPAVLVYKEFNWNSGPESDIVPYRIRIWLLLGIIPLFISIKVVG